MMLEIQDKTRSDIAQWYVLHLKPNGLKIAQINLARQGYDTLMPMRNMMRPTRYGLQSSKRPIFPGYLFLSHMGGEIDWRAVSHTRGVARVITTTGGAPAQLPAQIAHDLLAATSADNMLTQTAHYQAGNHVGIINGPFTGWLAKVVDTDDTGRVRLLLDVMGRATQIRIAHLDIEQRHT